MANINNTNNLSVEEVMEQSELSYIPRGIRKL